MFDDMQDEYWEFVNDEFNWTNANYTMDCNDPYVGAKKQMEILFWTQGDPDSLYKLNSMGYRSDEFNEYRKMVFINIIHIL